MRVSLVIGLIAALTSTVLLNLAYLREQGAVAGMPELSLRRPLNTVKLLLTNPAWLVGFAMESGGFALFVLALALAPLALVQSVGAGGLGVLAFATARLGRRRLRRHELLGSSIAVIGLILLGVSLSGGTVSDARGSIPAIVLWLALTVGAGVLVLAGSRTVIPRAVGDGIAGGLFFAVGDICTKVATQGGGRVLFAIPLIAGYLIGTALLQIGYQSGTALTVAGLGTLLTNAVPIAAGTIVLDEQLPSGALGVIRVLAFAAVTAGAILLARPPAKPAHAPGATAAVPASGAATAAPPGAEATAKKSRGDGSTCADSPG
ncbi:MAG: hypothetical protein ACYCXW_11845 [Solirubrobacteraceae bacterium]